MNHRVVSALLVTLTLLFGSIAPAMVTTPAQAAPRISITPRIYIPRTTPRPPTPTRVNLPGGKQTTLPGGWRVPNTPTKMRPSISQRYPMQPRQTSIFTSPWFWVWYTVMISNHPEQAKANPVQLCEEQVTARAEAIPVDADIVTADCAQLMPAAAAEVSAQTEENNAAMASFGWVILGLVGIIGILAAAVILFS